MAVATTECCKAFDYVVIMILPYKGFKFTILWTKNAHMSNYSTLLSRPFTLGKSHKPWARWILFFLLGGSFNCMIQMNMNNGSFSLQPK